MTLSPNPPTRMKFGTPDAGFEVIVEPARHLCWTRPWGLWDISIAMEYHERGRVLVGPLLVGEPWFAIGDLRHSQAQNPEVQKARMDTLLWCAGHGLTRIAYLVDSRNPFPKLQMRRIAASAGIGCEFFVDDSAALAWLFAHRPELRDPPRPD
ncbi:MAG: hypothetical protein ACT4TC_23715 [Myxococcaceae bacterium]